MKRKFFKWMLWLAAACLALVVLDQVLPYSRSHLRRIEAMKLRMFVKEWEGLGRPSDYVRTNKSGTKVYLFEQTLSIDGTNFHGFMRMESSRVGGYLLADTNSRVLRCDSGRCKPVK